ncbi:hypothetical protein DFH09DRAFT_1100267 [Mycena vulgaris]|nr:hypothetical protein DFH09DRAFT_1100267 [Mycena vulgaris]
MMSLTPPTIHTGDPVPPSLERLPTQSSTALQPASCDLLLESDCQSGSLGCDTDLGTTPQQSETDSDIYPPLDQSILDIFLAHSAQVKQQCNGQEPPAASAVVESATVAESSPTILSKLMWPRRQVEVVVPWLIDIFPLQQSYPTVEKNTGSSSFSDDSAEMRVQALINCKEEAIELTLPEAPRCPEPGCVGHFTDDHLISNHKRDTSYPYKFREKNWDIATAMRHKDLMFHCNDLECDKMFASELEAHAHFKLLPVKGHGKSWTCPPRSLRL